MPDRAGRKKLNKRGAAMLKKLSALPILTFVTLNAPLQAIAQTQQPNAPPHRIITCPVRAT
jgi:hypothetical protein